MYAVVCQLSVLPLTAGRSNSAARPDNTRTAHARIAGGAISESGVTCGKPDILQKEKPSEDELHAQVQVIRQAFEIRNGIETP